MLMSLFVHVEVIYDSRKPIPGLLSLPPSEVVVKRLSLESDFSVPLQELCLREGQKIIDTAPAAVAGYRHRVVITGVQIDGVMFSSPKRMVVPLKCPQFT